MRSVLMLLVCGVLLGGCGDGDTAHGPPTAKPVAITADDLRRHGAPLVVAHDALVTFQDKVEAGLSNAAVVSEWPAVSAEVKKRLRLYAEQTWPGGWSSDDQAELAAYQGSIQWADTQWGVVTDAIRTLIQTGRESDKARVVTEYTTVQANMAVVATAREAALKPGKAVPAP